MDQKPLVICVGFAIAELPRHIIASHDLILLEAPHIGRAMLFSPYRDSAPVIVTDNLEDILKRVERDLPIPSIPLELPVVTYEVATISEARGVIPSWYKTKHKAKPQNQKR